MVERETGRVHAKHVPSATRGSVTREIDAAVAPEARFMTDESVLYKNLKDRGFEHEIVVHSVNQWVRGEVHTQGIDGFWSLLKARYYRQLPSGFDKAPESLHFGVFIPVQPALRSHDFYSGDHSAAGEGCAPL